ncbi:permease [Gordonia sp. TBRC 11910]|uniref:Permease n=1 Tax=Gordonia asplenii TaxID=2725283 RepID=A0A848L249_9ACTN|nr:permease [Gordonia asplenii]NMO02683.1 permease [Gordonia asplenii]
MTQLQSPTETTESDEAPVGRWSLTMAWWSLFSAMFWLYISAASAAAYGPRATLIGLVATVVTYGAINRVLATYALRTGRTVETLSQLIFGRIGATCASLLLAATALYYGVFEGSVIAASLQNWFGGNIKLWYLACVLYAVPLAFGGVRHWLDRLNGFLLPFYVVGLVALVVAATVRQGYPSGWLSAPGPTSTLPGWLGSYLIFMGVWVMMMFTIDFASLGKAADARFHRRATFGPLFYACTFGVNGLIGIYIVTAFGVGGTETGVVQAVVGSLGFAGVVLIVISQTRINTANYYLASTNLEAVARGVFGVRLPHIVWVVVCGVAAYSLMLTDVLGYLLQALAWQAVLIVAWVAVVLVHVLLRRNHDRGENTQVTSLAMAWLAASVVGIGLHQQTYWPTLATVAPLVTFLVGAIGAGVVLRRGGPGVDEVQPAG